MNEKGALQAAIAIAGVIPVLAGLIGAIDPAALGLESRLPETMTHAAYLSGLLLGIGLGFWSCVPAIETKKSRFTILAVIVVLAGLARLFLAIRLGTWNPAVTLPLAMELGVTPALWLWMRRLSR